MLQKGSIGFQKLLNQGYPEEMILLAIQESDTKSFGDVADILYFREKHYEKILQARKLANHNQKPVINDKENMKDEKKVDQKGKSLVNSANKYLDKDLVVFLEMMIADLKKEGIDDPNQYLVKLAGYAEQIRKGESNETIKKLWKHLWSLREPPLIQDLKNAIFFVLSRVLTMKINVDIDPKKLEFCLENAFGMRLLTSNQMSSLIASCKKFNVKAKFWDDNDFFDRLYDCCVGLGWGDPPPWDSIYINRSISWREIKDENEEGEEEKISEEEKEKLIAKARAKEKRREMQEQRERADEERKFQLISKLKIRKNESFEEKFEADESGSDIEAEIEVEEKKAQELEDKKVKVMEECLICMKNIREVVFLPCCHFLTCSDCSAKVDKCPLCSQGIEKNQKIYWS